MPVSPKAWLPEVIAWTFIPRAGLDQIRATVEGNVQPVRLVGPNSLVSTRQIPMAGVDQIGGHKWSTLGGHRDEMCRRIGCCTGWKLVGRSPLRRITSHADLSCAYMLFSQDTQMPDKLNATPDDFDVPFTLHIACESYHDLDYIRGEVANMPRYENRIAWQDVQSPDPNKLNDGADLVFIITDAGNLGAAIGRYGVYRQRRQTCVLIKVHDEANDFDFPGLSLIEPNVTSGILDLVNAMLMPALVEGAIPLDWADMRDFLSQEGHLIVESVTGADIDSVMDAVLHRFRRRVSGRIPRGLLLSAYCTEELFDVVLDRLMTAGNELETAYPDLWLNLAMPWEGAAGAAACEVRLLGIVGNGEA